MEQRIFNELRALSNLASDINERVSKIERKVDLIEGKVDQIEGKVNHNEGKVDQIESALVLKFGIISRNFEGVLTELKKIQETLRQGQNK